MKLNRLCIILSLLVVAGIALYLSSDRCTSSAPRSFRVMSFNVGDCNWVFPSAEKISRIISDAGPPEILLLQEVRGEKQVGQLLHILKYPYHAAIPYKRQERSYLAIFSMYPLEQVEHLYFQSSREGSGALSGIVRYGGRTVFIYSIHLDQIPSKSRLENGYIDQTVEHTASQLKTEIFDDTIRSRSANELISWIQGKGQQALIIGGDFNTIPFSTAIRAMNASFDDALWPSKDYFTGTYFKIKSPLLPRVDYIFHSADLCVSNPEVIRKSPGDHYPVRATFHIGIDTHAKN
jgi:endonuclease/exonuclease/phosphatase family metal-dependent hydrolase